MAKAHGQMPSAKNAPTASAGPRYEPVAQDQQPKSESHRRTFICPQNNPMSQVNQTMCT